MKTSYALLISTTCQRLGLGLFIFALIAYTFFGINLPMNIVAFIALATLGVGGIASAAHLARPNRFLNAFSNFKSHLTQEALVTPFLGAALLACSLNGFFYTLGESTFMVLLWVTFILAMAFLISTGLVYQLKARPAWNTPFVLIIFLTTAAQVGTLFTSAVSMSLVGNITVSLVVTTALMYVLCIVAQYIFIQHLKGLGHGVAVNVTEQPYKNTFLTWLLAIIVVAICYATFLVGGNTVAVYSAVIFSIIGIMAWTVLFYKTALLVRKFPQYSEDLNVYM